MTVLERRMERVAPDGRRFWHIRVLQAGRAASGMVAEVQFGADNQTPTNLRVTVTDLESVGVLIRDRAAAGFVEVAIPEGATDVGGHGRDTIPPLPLLRETPAPLTVRVLGGVALSWRELMDREYGSQAAGQVSLCGLSHEVGARSGDLVDWSSASVMRLVDAPRAPIAISRTALPGLELLRESRVVATTDGSVLIRGGRPVAALSVRDDGSLALAQGVERPFGEPDPSPLAMAMLLGHLYCFGGPLLGAPLWASVRDDWSAGMQVPSFGFRANHAQYVALQALYGQGHGLVVGGEIWSVLSNEDRLAIGVSPAARGTATIGDVDLDA